MQEERCPVYFRQMRSPLIVVMMGVGPLALSQGWCPPGATWTYDHLGFVGIQGYTVMTYTHDTVLGGLNGQVINSMTVGVNWDEEVDTMSAPVHVITRHDGQIVFIWSHWEQSWDTLYHFAAGPGDSWAPPHSTPICGSAELGDLVQVIDSGTVMVDGMPLHYVDIHCGFNNGRIVERLGWSVGMFIAEGCWVPECICDLRCYHDDVLDYVRPGITLCDSIPDLTTGLEDPDAIPPVISPNPGTDHFSLTLTPGLCTMLLFDATGRELLRSVLNGDRTQVNTSALEPGLYPYFLLEADGTPLGQGRWIKE